MNNGKTLAGAVVLYVRKSTREDERQAHSLADQEAALRHLAEERGESIVRVYSDAATGTDANRPGFQQLLADAESAGRDFGAVLVYDVSRFGRFGPDELGHYHTRLNNAGVRVTYKDIPAGRDGRLIASLNGHLAEQFSVSLSKNSLRGMLSGAQAGRWQGGTPPFGYDLAYIVDGEVKQLFRWTHRRKACLFSDAEFSRLLASAGRDAAKQLYESQLCPSSPERVAAIQRMFELAASGLGLHGVANQLNEEGHESPMGKGWQQKTVGDYLRHPAYRGDRQWGRTRRSKFHTFAMQDGRPVQVELEIERGKHRVKAKGNAVIVPRHHQGLVSAEQWDDVQRAREANRRTRIRGNGTRSEYLLSSLLKCGECGRSYVGTTNRQKCGDYQRYECSGYKMGGKKICGAPSVSGSAIHDAVTRAVTDYVQGAVLGVDSGALDREIRSEVNRRTKRNKRTKGPSVEKRREQLDKKITALARRMGDYPDLIEELAPELRRLKDERVQLAPSPEAVSFDSERVVRAAVKRAENVQELLSGGDVAACKGALRQLLTRVELNTTKGTFAAYVAPIPSESSPNATDAPPSVTYGEIVLRGKFRIAKRGRRMGKGRAS